MAIVYLILLFVPIINFASEPKREMRAAWIASVFNIDWPSNKGLSEEEQKKELIELLDLLQKLKFNAAILQIKPTSDTFYQSDLSPWSRFLTGIQGKNPGYDPLQFFIEEAQKRALETHVWVNPYRILNGEGFETLCKNHIARKKKNWVIEYNKRYYFDPGNPEVQAYITKEIMEIVNQYDIDALHMDDYFYPYKSFKNGSIEHFNDDASWKKYGKQFNNRDDWRRNNVDTFIKNISQSIKNSKKYVQFGISPFGVWRNKSKDPKGSDTLAGQTNYDDLYADVLKWIDNKWIDYIMPQIYWHFDTKTAPYDTLVQWWNTHVKNKVNLYIGIGVYKLNEQNWPTSHIKEQIDFKRKFPYVDGASYYSIKWIQQDTKGIKNYIKNEIYPNYALIPESKNLSGIKPFQVSSLQLDKKNNEYYLSWKNEDKELSRYFVVYQFKKNSVPDTKKSANIIGIVSAKQLLTFKIPKYNDQYTYGVTAVSRLHQESTLFTLEDTEKQRGLNILDNILDSSTVTLK